MTEGPMEQEGQHQAGTEQEHSVLYEEPVYD